MTNLKLQKTNPKFKITNLKKQIIITGYFYSCPFVRFVVAKIKIQFKIISVVPAGLRWVGWEFPFPWLKAMG